MRTGRDGWLSGLALATAGAALATMVLGGLVRADGAALACPDWPTCGGRWLPPLGGPAALEWAHRAATVGLGGLLAAWTGAAWWRARGDGWRTLPPTLASALLLVQVVLGGLTVSFGAAGAVSTLHGALAAVLAVAVLGAAGVTLRRVARREARVAGGEARVADGQGPVADGDAPFAPRASRLAPRWAAARPVVGTYIALMKPRIIVLLLITTLGAMVLAQGGWPPTGLVLLTMLGGALSAGGANAINQYLDRDIDERMARTRRRPLPSHRVEPRHALIFGVGLGAAAFGLLTVWVNPLAAMLSLCGLLFYVIVYTLWMKRSTPHNIVIGGAAGAIPPLVGWAAVTGSLSLPAFYLFAIIFFWTPPHFWALSLLLKADYAEAGIPMLPVTAGEAETKRQIILYSLLLIGVTLLLFAGRFMGVWYLAAALGLGAVLLGLAVALARGAERLWARRLFLFSNAYLALLFVAMIVDSVVLRGGGDVAGR